MTEIGVANAAVGSAVRTRCAGQQQQSCDVQVQTNTCVKKWGKNSAGELRQEYEWKEGGLDSGDADIQRAVAAERQSGTLLQNAFKWVQIDPEEVVRICEHQKVNVPANIREQRWWSEIVDRVKNAEGRNNNEKNNNGNNSKNNGKKAAPKGAGKKR